MDDHYRSKEAEESQLANTEDVIVQMKDRLRQQSQRIRSLESYKVLCEERLTELYPSHPLPVLPEHIGSGGSSTTQELLNYKQKIAKLEQHLSQSAEMVPSQTNSVTYNKLHELYTLLHQKYNSILKEKTELEESLRNEMLSNEEQRAYIEVLKQAIEIRIESLGLKGINTEEFAEFSSARISIDESKRETSRMTTKIIDYEAQIKSLTESLKIKSTECKELAIENEEITEQLHQAAEAIQHAENEVQKLEDEIHKLEEEKRNLIDYAEAQTKSEQKIKNELKESKNRLGNLQEEYKKVSKNLSLANDENKKITNELETVKTEYNRNEKTLKETQQGFLNMKSRVEEKDRALQKYKEENNSFSIQNSSLQAENITLNENMSKLDGQVCAYKVDLERSKTEENRLKENLAQMRSNIQQLQEEKYRIEKNYIEAEHKIQNIQGQYEIIIEKYNGTSKMLQNANHEVENLKNVQKLAVDKEESSAHLVSDLKKQILTLQNEIESLVKIQQNTSSDLVLIREDYEQLRLKFLSLEQENDVLRKKNRDLNNLIEEEGHNARQNQEEVMNLKYQLEEMNKTVEFASDSFKEKELQAMSAEKDAENLTMIIHQTQSELAQEKYQRTNQYEELCIITNEHEKLKREFSSLKDLYEMACRAARSMSSQLSPMNTGNFKDFTMTFAETLPSDFSLHKWVEKAVNELKDICDKYTDAIQQMDSIKHKNNLFKQDLELLSQENNNFKSKELMLRSQIESMSKENTYLRENVKFQTNGLQQEILSLRTNIQSLYEENESLLNKNRSMSNELLQTKSRISANEQSFQSMDKRYKLAVTEKEHLESLLSSYKSMDRSFSNSYRNSN
ncbi:hypothetical protein SteCoe_10579 [Stentor coeruleus]|uniref:Uncharacterized protein n=1 Tax=Stentor coeruleus TaxID=5963 RepID=A0A1R2CF79_9CILI|nr:hypothetical protein SteCoe_10579 [Stentor coeruleus]